MKILISGATGLVGKVIVKQALIEGHQIHFLTTQKAKIYSIKGAKGFYWNPNKNQIDVSCFDGIDTLIHLAVPFHGIHGKVKVCIEYKHIIYLIFMRSQLSGPLLLSSNSLLFLPQLPLTLDYIW